MISNHSLCHRLVPVKHSHVPVYVINNSCFREGMMEVNRASVLLKVIGSVTLCVVSSPWVSIWILSGYTHD